MLSKAEDCGLSIAGIAGSSPTKDMGSSLAIVVCCVGSSLCDELIARSGESYWVCACLIACHIETSTMRPSKPDSARSATKKKFAENLETVVNKFKEALRTK